MRAWRQPKIAPRLAPGWVWGASGLNIVGEKAKPGTGPRPTVYGNALSLGSAAASPLFRANASRVITGSMTVFFRISSTWETGYTLRVMTNPSVTKGLSLYKGMSAGTAVGAAGGYTWNPTNTSVFTYTTGQLWMFVVCQYDHAAKTVTNFLPNGSSNTAGVLSGSYGVPTDPEIFLDVSGTTPNGGMVVAGVYDGLFSPRALFQNPWQIFEAGSLLYTGMGSGEWTPLEVSE